MLFPTDGEVHPRLRSIAERRAFAVVHEENRARLSEVFLKELRVLKRRDISEVFADAGLKYEPTAEDVEGGWN